MTFATSSAIKPNRSVPFAVALVLEAHRLKGKDCFASIIHWPDRFFEPLGRSGRAKLTIFVHHIRVTDNRSPTDASDISGRVRGLLRNKAIHPCDHGPYADGVRLGINTRVSDDNIVVARQEGTAGRKAHGDVAAAPPHLLERVGPMAVLLSPS